MTAIGTDIARVATTHIDRAFRYVLRGPGVVSDRRFVRWITGEPHPLCNAAIISDPTDLSGMEAAIAPLLHCGGRAAVLFMGSVSASAEDQLKAAGFESHGAMPAMAVDIDSLLSTGLPPAYSLTRIGSGPEGDEWADAFSVGYELPPGVGRILSPNAVSATTTDDAPVQYFAIRKNGKLVSTSLVYLADGVAGVYCVATIREERGRGLGAYATAQPLRLVRKLGYRVGVLQSSPAGHSVYRKLGFADVGEVPLYVSMPG